jgi:hypothetical protein
MALAFAFKGMTENCIAIIKKSLGLHMKLHYALFLGLLCGLMDHTSVASGLISNNFGNPLQVFGVQRSMWMQIMATLLKLL